MYTILYMAFQCCPGGFVIFVIVSFVHLRIDKDLNFTLMKKKIEHLRKQRRKILQLLEFWNLRQYMLHTAHN